MIFSIIFPLLCGLICIFTKNIRSSRLRDIIFVCLQATETVAGLAVVFSDQSTGGNFSFAKEISIGFTSDMTAKFFCLITVIAWLFVSIYSVVYMKHEKNIHRFCLFMFLSESALLGAIFSSNLISMYFFYELVTLFSMPLVLHSLTKESIAAAKKYLFYSVAGAFAALFGIFILAKNTTTLDFTAGGTLTQVTPLVLTAIFMMNIGFGAKAGLFPLHGWLPSAHPVAPAPASALLSGLIAKAGVLAIIRTVFFIAGTDALSGTWVQTTLLILSLVTVFMGSMMAYREKIFKKRLAYSTVSQISYVLTGIFLFSEAGIEGALWQILFHAAVKVGLFLCAGAVIYLYGKTQVEELEGLGKKMPVTFICFTILALSLTGIPPTGGFFSKWYLASASLEAAQLGALSWIIPVVLLVSALLTAGYLLPVSIKGFWGSESAESETKTVKEPLLMVIPLVLLSLIALAGGIFANKTGNILSEVASSLF